jgi:hypothetical protein
MSPSHSYIWLEEFAPKSCEMFVGFVSLQKFFDALYSVLWLLGQSLKYLLLDRG